MRLTKNSRAIFLILIVQLSILTVSAEATSLTDTFLEYSGLNSLSDSMYKLERENAKRYSNSTLVEKANLSSWRWFWTAPSFINDEIADRAKNSVEDASDLIAQFHRHLSQNGIQTSNTILALSSVVTGYSSHPRIEDVKILLQLYRYLEGARYSQPGVDEVRDDLMKITVKLVRQPLNSKSILFVSEWFKTPELESEWETIAAHMKPLIASSNISLVTDASDAFAYTWQFQKYANTRRTLLQFAWSIDQKITTTYVQNRIRKFDESVDNIEKIKVDIDFAAEKIPKEILADLQVKIQHLLQIAKEREESRRASGAGGGAGSGGGSGSGSGSGGGSLSVGDQATYEGVAAANSNYDSGRMNSADVVIVLRKAIDLRYLPENIARGLARSINKICQTADEKHDDAVLQVCANDLALPLLKQWASKGLFPVEVEQLQGLLKILAKHPTMLSSVSTTCESKDEVRANELQTEVARLLASGKVPASLTINMSTKTEQSTTSQSADFTFEANCSSKSGLTSSPILSKLIVILNDGSFATAEPDFGGRGIYEPRLDGQAPFIRTYTNRTGYFATPIRQSSILEKLVRENTTGRFIICSDRFSDETSTDHLERLEEVQRLVWCAIDRECFKSRPAPATLASGDYAAVAPVTLQNAPPERTTYEVGVDNNEVKGYEICRPKKALNQNSMYGYVLKFKLQ